MRRIRVSAISTPSSTGSAPPDSPVPEPRATHGTPARWHTRDDVGDLVAAAGEHRELGMAAYCSSPSDS